MALTSDILKRTLAIIQERGWTYLYSSGLDGPLNIRSAVSRACTKLCSDSDFHDCYVTTVEFLGEVTQDGITYWEFGGPSARRPKRTQAEVEHLLMVAIERMEKHEAQVGGGKRPGRSGSDSRTV